MSEKKLKKRLQEHYIEYELNHFQIERLTKYKKRQLIPYFVVPSFVCLLIMFYFFYEQNTFSHKIMEEVVYNHNKGFNSEILSYNFNTIQKKLNKLDFTLVQTKKLKKGYWRVIGARYCSIQGKIAAQIKIQQSSSGDIYTLYQAKIKSRFKLENQSDINGVHVRLWEEKGVLIALAGP
jgi:hypothetical protein